MKAFLCFCLIAISSSAYAQLDNLFYKFDAHAGYALPLGSGYPINGGFAINAEPKVYYNKNLVLGGKIGFNFLNSPASNVKLAPLSTFVLVGEKYTEEDELRFFYGASAGLYMGGQTKTVDGKPTGLRAKKILGLAPRAGVQFGPYRVMAEYHIRKNEAKFVSIMLGYAFRDE
jgi:hypothetical protein